MVISIVKCNNSVVTDAYMELIGLVLSNYDSIRYFSSISECLNSCRRDEVVVVARTVDAFQAIIRGYKRIFMWFQGVEPEESYMSHHSPLRRDVLSMMEKIILSRGVFFFFVSEAMRKHYETKYNMTVSDDSYYVMPCQNTTFHSESFLGEYKYSCNIFTYVGSLAPWQNFEATVELYKKIEKLNMQGTELRVYTFEEDKAKRILQDSSILHYSVSRVRNEEMHKALVDVKYGFIIRDDNIVNRVATPTKISTYLSCGVIPIYSECLEGFADVAQQMKFAVPDNSMIFDKLKLLQKVNPSEVENEYRSVFHELYDRDRHISELGVKVKDILSKTDARLSR